MKTIFTLLTSILFISFTNGQTVVDFSDAALGDTSFMAGGVEWKMTDDFLISEFDNFDCNENLPTNRYMDTGYSIGMDGSEGILGSIAPIDPTVTFQLADDHCAWPGSFDGEFTSTGTFKFLGVKPDGTTIEEDITLTSTNFNDFVSLSLSESIWDGVELASLQIEIVGTEDSTDYFVIDNLAFDAINVPSSVQSIEERGGKVFPNPTSGFIMLEEVEADEIQVYDNLGRLVFSVLEPENSLDISHLVNGMYILKIREENQYVSARIVKN